MQSAVESFRQESFAVRRELRKESRRGLYPVDEAKADQPVIDYFRGAAAPSIADVRLRPNSASDIEKRFVG